MRVVMLHAARQRRPWLIFDVSQAESRLNPFFQGTFTTTHAALKAARSRDDLHSVTTGAHGEIDRIFDEGMIHTRSAIACCAGCSYCCYLKVDARPAEVFAIVQHIRKHFSEAEKTEVLAAAGENRKKIGPMTASQHMGANLRCALLRDGRCSVYPVRPGLCRAFHAQRVQTCKDSFEQPERMDLPHSQVPQIQRALTMAHQGIEKAFADSGYDSRPYELNSALYEALTSEKCEKRWTDKKAAFSRSALAKDYAENNQRG
jgi:Fe-S-cluster containining protein